MTLFWQVYGAVLMLIRITLIECDQRIITYTNMSCEQDLEIVNLTTAVKDGAISADLILHKELKSIFIDVKFYVKTADSASYSLFVKSSTDVCDFLANPGSNLFFSVMLEHMRRDKRNRIARRCPVRVGRYGIIDYRFDTNNLPPIIPNLAFYMTMETTQSVLDRKAFLKTRVEGTLDNVVKKQKRPRNKQRQLH